MESLLILATFDRGSLLQEWWSKNVYLDLERERPTDTMAALLTPGTYTPLMTDHFTGLFSGAVIL